MRDNAKSRTYATATLQEHPFGSNNPFLRSTLEYEKLPKERLPRVFKFSQQIKLDQTPTSVLDVKYDFMAGASKDAEMKYIIPSSRGYADLEFVSYGLNRKLGARLRHTFASFVGQPGRMALRILKSLSTRI